MSRRPLLWCAVALAAGMAAPRAASPATSSSIAVVLLCGAALLLRDTASRAAESLAIVFLLTGFIAAGALSAAVARMPGPFSIDRLVEQHEERFRQGVEVSGRLTRLVRTRGEPHRHELRVAVARVKVGDLWLAASGHVLLFAPAAGAPPGLGRGDGVVLFAPLRLPAAARAPGAFDFRAHLRARGILATGSIKSWALVSMGAPERTLAMRVMRGLDSLRERLLDAIAAAFSEDPAGRRAAAVCMAMLVGERILSDEDEETLAMAGLNHLLAVSGFNVCLLAAVFLFALRCAGAGMRWGWIGTIPVLIGYLLLNDEESSVLRAVAMASAFLLGRACWRRIDMLNALGWSAIAVLAASPLRLGEPGFQLTYAATAALLLAGSWPARWEGIDPWRRWLLSGLLGTLTATAATLPLVAIHFHRVAPAALPANVVAGPLMAMAFIGSLILPVAAVVSPALAHVAAECFIAPLIDAVYRIAQWIVAVPGMSWRVPPPGVFLAAAYFAALGAACWLNHADGRRGLRCAVTLVWLTTAIALAFPWDTRPLPAGLAITMLDVGQGDSLLIETPAGERMLVDAGERDVGPALRGMGIARLDTVVVTHADYDHAGGMAPVLRDFHPAEMWLPAIDAPPGIMRDLSRLADRLGIRRRIVRAGDSYCRKGARVTILSAGETGRTGRNEGSIVMMVSGRGRKALLMGDAGRDTESRLPADALAADVLKVAHHGSRTATSGPFLSAVGPALAMISCGRWNRFGHPHHEVMERLEQEGIHVCRTDLDGTIGVVLAPGSTLLSGPCAPIRFRRGGR